MELKISQCSVGKFNLLSDEKSLSFYMSIYNEGKVVELNGVKAQLHYSGDPHEYDEFKDAQENLEYIFEKCLEYADRIYASTDYKAQCLTFAKVYQENFAALNDTSIVNKKLSIERQIEKLQRELKSISDLPDLTYHYNQFIFSQIKRLERWIAANNKEMESIIPDSDKHNEIKKKVEGYEQRIAELESKIIETVEE